MELVTNTVLEVGEYGKARAVTKLVSGKNVLQRAPSKDQICTVCTPLTETTVATIELLETDKLPQTGSGYFCNVLICAPETGFHILTAPGLHETKFKPSRVYSKCCTK